MVFAQQSNQPDSKMKISQTRHMFQRVGKIYFKRRQMDRKPNKNLAKQVTFYSSSAKQGFKADQLGLMEAPQQPYSKTSGYQQAFSHHHESQS